MEDRLSLYDYLGFVLPGATVLATAIYGYDGWRWGEPGASAVLALVGASFIVGYLNAALGNVLESAALGGRVGSRPDSLWGTMRGHRSYDEAAIKRFSNLLGRRYGGHSDDVGYRLAYTELQQRGLDAPLRLLNQHIGFCRGMMTACVVALGFVVVYAVDGRSYLDWRLWVPTFMVAAVLFAIRFRRFWARFGDSVLRGIAVIDAPTP